MASEIQQIQKEERTRRGTNPAKLQRPKISSKPNQIKEKLEKQRELEAEAVVQSETDKKKSLEEEFKKWEDSRQQRDEARTKAKADEPTARRRARTLSTANPVPALKPLSGPPKPIFKMAPKPKPTTDDRVMKEVAWPETKVLTYEEIFDAQGKPNPDIIKEHFLREGRIDKKAAISIITKAAAVLAKEPNLLDLEPPVLIVGDIHGQFYDLIHILTEMGDPKHTQYLFLGDYVDRGAFGCEVTLLLMSYKICYPYSFYMLRGNHESRLLTAHFNFKKECILKYGSDVYDAIMAAFDALPVAATTSNIQGNFFCTHGGLSPSITMLEEIEDIDRFMEPPDAGPLCDLLWSDPIEEETALGLTEDEFLDWFELDFIPNPTRGCGYVFGYAAIANFLANNNLLTVIRAHEVQKEGYFCHNYLKDDIDFPLTITVFSAPNYCDAYGNAAACVKITPTSFSFEQVGWVDHPFILPNFMNGITYSIPFAMEAFTKLAACILENFIAGDGEEDEIDATIREKIRNFGKVSIIAQQIREEKDAIIKGKVNIGDLVTRFEKARQSDKYSDKRRPASAFTGEVVKRRTKTF